jgi:hypothetical protein
MFSEHLLCIGRRRALLLLFLLPLLLVACSAVRSHTVSAPGNLGATVNSPEDEYAPVLPDSATLLFTSNRMEQGEGGLQELLQQRHPPHLYFTMRLESGWDSPWRYRPLLGKSATGVATISFAPPGGPLNATAYLGACDRPDTIGGCDIYAVVGGGSENLLNLGGEINSKGWDGHPSATSDGKRLYFASDRSGGFGGTDIWYVERLPGDVWGTPQNAGPDVNTTADELSPFLDPATGALYFATTVEGSGLDIARIDPGSHQRTILPPPYNSRSDDFTPYIANNTLYLSSNRDGGCGGYDLYGFRNN